MLPLPKGAVWQALLVLCMVLLVREARSEARVVCYYTNWSVYRPGTAKFNPQNINPYLCTHLIYAFGGFTKDNTLKPFDKYQDIEQGGYAKFTGLKTYNKQLKTMLAIGGWNEASSRFSPLVANPERRQQFIRNILKFLRQNHFDGLDLDWEYPAYRDGGKPRDRDNYAQFVEELRSEFDRESSKTGRPRLLLTMAVPAGIEYIEKGYDIPKLNRYLDWFNILSYDYHSAFEPSVNHHSPLYSLEEESEYNYDTELNIDYSIKFYLKAGADRNKLVLGIPTYGRSYTLINADDTAIGAPADGPGEQGDATREKGYLAYYEICQSLLDNDDWTVVQPNPDAMGPYAHRGDQWVGYDDEAIVRKKAVYVAQNGLGGIMFWSIDNDDFRGTCTGKPYPLIEAAKEALLEQLGIGDNEVAAPSRTKKPSRSRSRQGSSTRNKVTEQPSTTVRQTTTRRKSTKKRTSTTARPTSASRTTTTPSSSLYIGGRTTTPAPPTTPDPGSDFKCEEEGFFSHPRDCKKYFWCLDSGPSNLGIVAHQFTCPSGLYFNTAADSCDFTRNVLCKKTATTTAEVKTTPIPKTTTTTTTTTQSSKRITAATSRNSFLRFTSTTPASIDDDEDEEYEDDEEEVIEVPHDKESEEDPRVIKELIDLIKRVGGLDELEKQLQLQEDGSVVMKNTKTDTVSTTPSSISKSLYAKVLSRPNNLNALRGQLDVSKLIKFNKKKEETISTVDEREETTSEKKYSSINRNSRPSPQNAGIDKLAEFEGFLKEKPKYVTINRPRPTKIGDDEEEDDEDFDEESDVEDDTTEAAQRKSTSAYVNIQRSRPTKSIAENQKTEDTEIAENEEEGGSKISYQSINRNRGTVFSGLKNEETEETKSSATTISTAVTNEDNEEDAINKPKSPYQSLNRNRPSSTAASLTLDKTEKKDDDGQTLIKSTYQSLTRNRSTASPTLDAKDETEDEASIQLRAKSTYQSFTRNRSTFAPSDEETAAQSTISSNLSQNDGKQNEDQVKIKSTYQSLTRNRSTAAPRVTEHDEKEDEATIQLRAKSTYQTFSRNRSTTASSIDKDKEDEDQAQIRTKSTYQSFTRNRSTTGSSVTDIEANEEAEAPNRSTLQFLSRRGSTATPSEAQIEEEGNGSLRSKSSYQTLSRTRGATTSSANDETTVGSISTTNRFKLYDRTRPTTVGSVQTELSSGVEGAKDRDDLSQSITVQYSESTQYTTTPSSTPIQEQDITDRIYANVARRSSTPSPLTITTIPPSSSLPSDTSILELEPAETTIPSLNNPSSIIPAPEILPSLTSEAVPTSEASIPVPTDVLSEKTLTASTTPSGLDTEAYTTSLKTETKSDTNSNLNQDDKVILTEIKTELHKDGKKEGNFIATEQLTNSNSKSESSLIKSNESSLSNIDSVSDLTITRTTSTTKSPVKTDKLTTNRFNTRRKTFSTTSTTTTELPEKEFLGTVSSPRPFGFPRRRTRPQSQTSTTENSPVPEASSSSATPTTKKFASRRGGNYKVNATGTTTNTTTDVRNATTTTVNGRRVAVFKIRRPANKSPLFRTDGGEVGERNRTLIELDDSKYTETETIEQTARTTESTVAKRKYTVKRLVRKRPVSSTTPLPIRTRSSTASASTTEEIEDLDLASTTASTLAPKRRFRKVIKKLKVITNATTVAPTRAPFKPIPIASSRTHLLREKDTNATIEDEASSSSTTSNLDARTSKSLDIEESSNSILLETGTSKSTLSELDEASKTIEPEIVATKATPTGIERANSTLAEIEASNSTLLNIEVSNPSLSEARILNTTVLNNSESDSSILNLSVEDKSNSTIQDILNSTLLATENSFGNSTSSPDSGIASNETTTEEAVISTTKSKLFVSRRPYKPTKPSVSAITSTESTSSTPRNYVRKYSSNFTAPKLPSEIDNPVGIIAAKIPSLPSKGGKRFKTNFKSTTARTTPRLANDEEDEEEEEEYEDEDDEVPHKIALIKPNYVLTNRAPPPGAKLESESFEGESDEEYEDDEAPHQAPKPQVVIAPTILNLGGPGQQSQSVLLPNGIDQIDLLKMVGLLPAQLPSQLPTQNLQTATESGAIVRLNNGFVGVLKKSESKEGDDEAIETTTTTTTTTRRLPTNYRITRPSNKPRVVNRPVVTTIHPASLRHAVTNPPKPTTPAAFRTNNTRNYERKYSPSSTEGTIQDNSLLEDLNVDALSARNKKIFEKTSRKHTTAKPKTTQKDQNETDITYNTTQLHNFSGDESDFNNINQFQENVLENSLYPPATPAPSTSTTAKITTLRHIFEINDRGQTTTDQPEYDDRVQFVSNSDPLKLVEINRIVEIYSKENKFKVNQKDHKTQNISSSELKLEQLPTIDHLGEISRITLVNLIDSGRVRSDEVRGRSLDYSGDIKIEGRSTVADYTPTEPIPVTEFTPVRNAIPQSQESQNNRDKSGREIFVPAVISGVETSTISLQGLFEAPRKSKSGRVINSPVFATSLGETQTRSKVINESQRRLDLADDRTTTPIPPTTTTTDQPKPTEQSRSVNYVRPLVPLLRPESNESSPLVISIANLDKVILSRVPKDGSVASSGRINTYIEAPKALLLQSGGSTLQSPDTHTEHYTEPIVETQTSYSSEIHIVRKRMPRKHKRTTHTTHNTGAVA